MVEPMNSPALLLVLHDVAPPTWADYQPFVKAVDALGGVPVSYTHLTLPTSDLV